MGHLPLWSTHYVCHMISSQRKTTFFCNDIFQRKLIQWQYRQPGVPWIFLPASSFGSSRVWKWVTMFLTWTITIPMFGVVVIQREHWLCSFPSEKSKIYIHRVKPKWSSNLDWKRNKRINSVYEAPIIFHVDPRSTTGANVWSSVGNLDRRVSALMRVTDSVFKVGGSTVPALKPWN